MVHLSLPPNPSHLEAVNPVVLGKVRARQDQAGDTKRRPSVHGILMHGDAAFAGQGLVAETLAMSQLIGYRTGGTIHLVINNQIGFTTVPAHAYSGLYCTDVAKIVQAPILHVNGDDPEAVVFCARMATEFRKQLHARHRHRHRLLPPPRPQRGRRAGLHPAADVRRASSEMQTTRTLYAETAGARGQSLSAEESKAMCDAFDAHAARTPSRPRQSFKPNKADWLEGHWAGLQAGRRRRGGREAARDRRRLDDAARGRRGARHACRPASTCNPQDRAPARSEASRRSRPARASTGRPARRWPSARCCWKATACACPARTCQRGTFTQRHAVLVDQTNEAEYVPLNNIAPEPGAVRGLSTSLLSRSSACSASSTATRWPTRTRWCCGRRSSATSPTARRSSSTSSSPPARPSGCACRGLVMLLPHGYEGQGPEHSSARLERYLQLCAEDNMQVVQPDHAGQLLPRAAPPAEAQLPQAAGGDDAEVAAAPQAGGLAAWPTSAPAARFQHVIPEIDAIAAGRAGAARRAVPGKVYYDLLAERRDKGDRRRRHRARRAALPVPEDQPGRGARALPQRRGGVVPGGAREHGRLDLRRPRHRDGAERASTSRRSGRSMSAARKRRARPPASRKRRISSGAGSAGRRSARPRLSARRHRTDDSMTEIQVPTLGRERHRAPPSARWLKKAGEAVAADEPLVELETDKVTVEVNAPSAGVLDGDRGRRGRRGRGRRACSARIDATAPRRRAAGLAGTPSRADRPRPRRSRRPACRAAAAPRRPGRRCPAPADCRRTRRRRRAS